MNKKVLFTIPFAGGNRFSFREYDIFLKLHYTFTRLNSPNKIITKGKIHVMRTQLYDSDFALAKAEEEESIRQELRGNAAHLMLTKLHYSNKI